MRFVFAEDWLLAHPVAGVRAVLSDVESYPTWWPAVRAVARIDDRTALVVVRSTLPYALDLVLTDERTEDAVLRVGIAGDLRGWAEWTLARAGQGTRAAYAQEVEVSGRVRSALAMVGHPIVRWNHAWMMAQLKDGLVEEIRRR